MDSLIKTEEYYILVKELETLVKFYNEPFSELGGIDNINIPNNFTIFLADNLFKVIDKIRITTPDIEMNEFFKMISEVRHRVLMSISKIPSGQRACEIFLTNYEIVVERLERMSLLWNIEADMEHFYDLDADLNPISKFVKKRDLLDSWKSGQRIPKIYDDELFLRKICKYFETTRDLVNLETRYYGIDIRKICKNLDLEFLANELIRNNYLIPVHGRTFTSLLTGSTFYEPLIWLGGLSELNKLIKAIFSIAHQGDGRPKIEWKSFASCILVENRFQDPENIKGASSAKMESVQELKPFLSIVKSALLTK